MTDRPESRMISPLNTCRCSISRTSIELLTMPRGSAIGRPNPMQVSISRQVNELPQIKTSPGYLGATQPRALRSWLEHDRSQATILLLDGSSPAARASPRLFCAQNHSSDVTKDLCEPPSHTRRWPPYPHHGPSRLPDQKRYRI